MSKVEKTSRDTKEIRRNRWFAELVGILRTDEQKFELGLMDPEKEEFYDELIFGDPINNMVQQRDLSSRFLIYHMLKDYMEELKERKLSPLRLALNLSNSKVLVWAVIKEDDEKTERGLVLAEAVVNAKHHARGFHISSTIVEDCDQLPIPPQYKEAIPEH